MDNTRETLEVSDWTLEKKEENAMRIGKETKRLDLPSPS